LLQQSASGLGIDQNLQRHRAVSLRQHGFLVYNNFNNKCPITIIFGIVISKSMRHRKMVSFPTSPI